MAVNASAGVELQVPVGTVVLLLLYIYEIVFETIVIPALPASPVSPFILETLHVPQMPFVQTQVAIQIVLSSEVVVQSEDIPEGSPLGVAGEATDENLIAVLDVLVICIGVLHVADCGELPSEVNILVLAHNIDVPEGIPSVHTVSVSVGTGLE